MNDLPATVSPHLADIRGMVKAGYTPIDIIAWAAAQGVAADDATAAIRAVYLALQSELPAMDIELALQVAQLKDLYATAHSAQDVDACRKILADIRAVLSQVQP